MYAGCENFISLVNICDSGSEQNIKFFFVTKLAFIGKGGEICPPILNFPGDAEFFVFMFEAPNEFTETCLV